MENSQLKDLQEEVSEATKQYILTTFNSENGMKTYYLQMSNIIRSAHINPPIDTYLPVELPLRIIRIFLLMLSYQHRDGR